MWMNGSPGPCSARGCGEQRRSSLSLFPFQLPAGASAASGIVAAKQHHPGGTCVQGGPPVAPCSLILPLLLEPVPAVWCHLGMALHPPWSFSAQHCAAARAGAQNWPVCSASISVISEQGNAEWEKQIITTLFFSLNLGVWNFGLKIFVWKFGPRSWSEQT